VWYEAEELRARDEEVARVVLEGAAQKLESLDGFRAQLLAMTVRRIEVKHHE
jgi:hypothetical protein